MRVLVTGAGGQVGVEAVLAFERAGHEVVGATREQLDVSSRDSVLQAVTTVRPSVVVHAAAWTAVDACEGDQDRAMQVNALGTRHVAEGCRLVGAHLLYLSTDYVFSGELDRPHHEWDDTNPLSVYGRSKLGGEREALAGVPGATVVRTSWVFGANGANIVKTVLPRLAAGETLRFVDDQRGCPTAADDLASMLVRLATYRLTGVFHVTNQGQTTWFDFVQAVADAAGLDRGLIVRIKTADMDPPRPAPRPANSVLDNAALRLAGIPLLPDHHDAVARVVAQLGRGTA